jgi:hypothetical protein
VVALGSSLEQDVNVDSATGRNKKGKPAKKQAGEARWTTHSNSNQEMIMNEASQQQRGSKEDRELTPTERENLRVLTKIRPSIVAIVNEVLASHGLEVHLSRIDFADGKPTPINTKPCVMCCCKWGAYTCCTACS